MKRQILILMMVLMVSMAAWADVTINSTNFPDANFRSYLLSEYPSGTITTAQLSARTTLEVNNKSISNMKGVEYFTELTRLSCYGNNLTTVDVSQNTKLLYLNFFSNKLTSITGLDKCTVLEQLYLHYNNLTTVSVSSHSALRTLWVQQNPNLTGLYCWRNALTNVDVTGCTALKQLKIYNNNNLASINGLADCTALTWLDVEDTSFDDLTAVKSMTSLETLLAGNTKITTLETSHSGSLTNLKVGGDKQLTELKCYSENLTTLTLTGCTALETLKCYYNANLATITGLAGCTALTYLDCEDCAITELPGVNNMQGLQTLWVRNNQLTSLEVTHKSSLQYLRVKGNTGLTNLYCSNNALTSLDVSGCSQLQLLDCQSNRSLAQVTGLTDCVALDWFACDYCAVTSLDMTFATGLESLYCYNNNMTSLNVTGLTSLKVINCANNPGLGAVTGLADCTALTYIDCSNCGMTNLDVSQMNELNELWCSDNQFTYLEVANKPALTTLVASNNQELIDLACYNCALTTLEVINCSKLVSVDCRNNALSSLDLNSCPDLEYLLCNSNQLPELNLTNNPKLVYLWCNGNLLTSVDTSHFSDDFLSLDCRKNQIEGTIDMSRFNALKELACSDNKISQLILGNHPSLNLIFGQNNQLTSIDVSGCSALETLYLQANQLSTLDVSGLSALTGLYVQYNQLTSLNVSNCPALRVLPIYNNILTAGPMGRVVDDLPTLSADDRGTLYAIVEYPAESERVERNVVTASQVAQAAAKYWDVYCWNWDTSSWEPYDGVAFILGDVNGDGHVTISDVTALIDLLLGGGTTMPEADVNGDGSVSISDVTALIDWLLSGNVGLKTTASQGGMRSTEPTVPGVEYTMKRPFLDEMKPRIATLQDGE